MTFSIFNNGEEYRIKSSSWATIHAVAHHFDMAIFRDTTSFKVGDEWKGKRVMSYWCERLVTMGILEKKVQKRGWYTWTMYRSMMTYENMMLKLGDIPF